MSDKFSVKNARRENLLKNIDKLKTRFADPAFPEDLEVIKDWDATVKRAMIQESLVEHEGIILIANKIREEIEAIDVVLLNKPGLEVHERDIILVKKKMFEWFLNQLMPGEDLAVVEEGVAEALALTEAGEEQQ